MSVRDTLVKLAAKPLIMKAMSGEEKDLRRLCEHGKKMGWGLTKKFFEFIDNDLDKGGAMSKMLLNIGKETNKNCKNKFVQNLIFNQFLEGEKVRAKLKKEGTYVPALLVMSPTMRCNLTCLGCYSGKHQKSDDLPEEVVDDILTQAKEMGIYFIVISGGEPYLLKDMWFRLWKKHSDMYFLTFTNGTLITEEVAKKLAELGNVAPAISVEGFCEETDQRRGKGVYDRVLTAMSNLKKEGVLFGFSATVTKNNYELISSEEFIELYLDKGVKFGWYFLFMPVGKDPNLELMATPQQRLKLGGRVKHLREKYPVFAADFWNDGPAVGGCMAGRNYMHILCNGNVEPCVFVHFSVDNVKEKRLKDIINSDFFKYFRDKHPYSENKNVMKPCCIIDNPEVLRGAVEKFHPQESHEGSDDIVKNEKVREFVDNYAKEVTEIFDPMWEKEINDPNSIWYKEGEQYKKTFIDKA